MMLRHSRVLAVSLLLPAAACGDDTKGTTTDTTDTTDTDTSTDGSDADDATEVDSDQPDTAVPVQPLAKIYRVDPLITPNLEEVELEHLTSTDGSLRGSYANVRSCTPDAERGQKVTLNIGIPLEITSCVPEAKAFPGADGTYRDIAPAASLATDDGRFAEVMMYHHMQVVHDYFKDNFGLTDRDQPLEAVTNVQINVCNAWTMIANAAFFPAGSFEQLGLGLDFGIEGDSIIFSGSSKRNFSLDAAVIYHEYTHAMLGATRLSGVFPDKEGLNNLPGALNEAYADYFAATITNQSAIGNFALNDFEGMKICGFEMGGGGNLARDLENFRSCPGDLTAEVHADSEMFSSALWQIRKDLGATDADKVVLQAVLTLTDTSDFQIAAAATIDAAEELFGAEAKAKVEKAMADRGLIDCERVLPIERIGVRGLDVTLESPSSFQVNPYPGYAPGYLQYSFVVPEGTKKVTLTVTAAAGGGFGGGGALNLEAALKPGVKPIRYSYGFTAGSAINDAALTLPVTSGKVSFGSEESPPEAGTWTFALHNKGDGASLSKVVATFE